jgi:hypothetical protein
MDCKLWKSCKGKLKTEVSSDAGAVGALPKEKEGDKEDPRACKGNTISRLSRVISTSPVAPDKDPRQTSMISSNLRSPFLETAASGEGSLKRN